MGLINTKRIRKDVSGHFRVSRRKEVGQIDPTLSPLTHLCEYTKHTPLSIPKLMIPRRQ